MAAPIIAALLWAVAAARCAAADPHHHMTTLSGYLPIVEDDGSKMFFTYYESRPHQPDAPILLWLQVRSRLEGRGGRVPGPAPLLKRRRVKPMAAPSRCVQGGPGCASSFGNLYELGPWVVTPEGDLQLEANPGAQPSGARAHLHSPPAVLLLWAGLVHGGLGLCCSFSVRAAHSSHAPAH